MRNPQAALAIKAAYIYRNQGHYPARVWARKHNVPFSIVRVAVQLQASAGY